MMAGRKSNPKSAKSEVEVTVLETGVTLSFSVPEGRDRKRLADELKRRIAEVIDTNLEKELPLREGDLGTIALMMFTNFISPC